MALTDLTVKKAAPKEKRYMLADDKGLYLEVMTTGSKIWRYRRRLQGKEQKITIGNYPEFSLHEARTKLEEIRRRVAHGEPLVEVPKRTFREVAEEWTTTRVLPIRSEIHIKAVKRRLNNHIFPVIGDTLIENITPQDVLSLCRRLESRGIVETSHRIKQLVGQVIRYAIAIGEAMTDPTYSLKGALQSHKNEHFSTITEPAKIAVLVRDIAAYPKAILRAAMQFSMLTFARPGEVRNGEWSEVDWDKKEWRIPAEKMKMNKPHIVPLSKQALNILRELKETTGWQKWIFPSARMDGRPMSDNGVRIALRSMGYANEDLTPHGFRSMASTNLNENGFAPDMIERQLAHSEGNKVRAAYNHAEYLTERHNMMQWWADWLDEQRSK